MRSTRLASGQPLRAIVALLLCLAVMLPLVGAEPPSASVRELVGMELTYHYEGGRKYHVRFTGEGIAWQRLDVPGRSWEGPVPFVATRLGPDRYLVNWQRPERTEFITVYYDFAQRLMFTSALLEGRDRHFESARIVELKRP